MNWVTIKQKIAKGQISDAQLSKHKADNQVIGLNQKQCCSYMMIDHTN